MPDYELALYKKALTEVAHIMVTDANGTIIYVNDKLCRLTKYSQEELLGQNNRIFKSGFHPPEFYEAMYNDLHQGKIFKTVFKNIAKDGSSFWMDATIIPFLDKDNKPYKYLTIRFDITDKINEVTVKEEFLANVSHDIRTPLHGITSITQLLKETKLNEQQVDYIWHLQETTQHLEQLVNDLLDIFKIDSGKLQFEIVPLDVTELASSLISIYKIKSKNANIIYDYSVDPAIHQSILGDPLRIKQLLYNLLENATKYTERGTIKLDIRLDHEIAEKQYITFNVIDSGKGIPKDKQEQIFEKYIQSDIRDTRVFGGTGLGLSIVKSLVHLMNGTLSLSSTEGKGTTFSFTIPFRKVTKPFDLPIIESKPPNTIEPEKYRILIVDDDGINRMIFEKQMKKFKYQYTMVENGFDALDKLESEQYDLVLLDMQMPGMNGDEVLMKVRRDFPESKKLIPIICVSATVQMKVIQNIIDAGANAHLSKPYKEAELADLITQTLTKVSKMEEHENKDLGKLNKYVRIETLSQYADDDKNFMLELLEYFLSTAPELLEKMQLYFANNKFELAMLLHKYRSQVSLLGVTELVDDTKALEIALIENDNSFDCEGTFTKIIDASKITIHEVETIVQQLKEA